MPVQNQSWFSSFPEPPQFRRPGPPLYSQLADVLRQQIESGALPPGVKLPNLVEMGKLFGVARVTARQAVQLLVMEGFLTSRQGRGITVSRPLPARPYENMRTSWNAMIKRIEGAGVELLDAADVRRCPLADGWNLPAVLEYRYMRRVHIKDGARFAYIELYLDKAIYDRAPERFNATTVIPVMNELGVNVAKARQELTIGCASPEAARHLRIACGAPVAFVRRYACDVSGRAIYAAAVVHPGAVRDRFGALMPERRRAPAVWERTFF